MSRTVLLVALMMLAESSSAFHIQSPNVRSRHFDTCLFADTEEKKSLSSADILARARKAAGVEEEEKIFEDALLDDMQQILLTLETRVKDGPGSIPLLEIDQFQAMANNVLNEMKAKESERLNTLSSGSAPAAAAVAAAAPQLESAPVVTDAPAPAAPAMEAQVETPSEDTEEENNTDGPAYDGSGFGLAKGTANTWNLEGMDSMTPEEYQAAIQASISARQAQRKEQGVYGNRSTNDYMRNLGGGDGFLKN
eukprot:CAMPEP_0113612650 /NCGR_PEP_ID=MMETSP0017_2-20120614/6214_1 /TAXON_ID=2856 /ORGANISM="Cylindrotheca closterium" /LENGTH=251 /DNA_ID=CAMNT_0000521701 /DNA_START=65 /DNA_END=820 /DNA_ORIENTATION=+ /assembly_acc=CAM_ASM_000147